MSRAFAAVIPVLNEATAIGEVVRGLFEAGACCVFVVDGGSRDGTASEARAAGAVVIDEPRRGYGLACQVGADAATSPGPHVHDAIVLLDGDGSCRADDAARLVTALDAADTGAGDGLADVVLGRRPAAMLEPGAMPWHARLGNAAIAAMIAIRAGRRVSDLPPMKAVRPGVLRRLGLTDRGYGWTVQFVARALMDPDVRLREVPVRFARRRGGVSKVSGSAWASIRAGAAMIRVGWGATRSRPLIVIMAKAPGRGRAKTRIAADLGESATATLWGALLADTAEHLLEAARVTRAQPVAMLPASDHVEPVERIIGTAWTPVVQSRPGLVAGLVEAFLAAFDRGADRAIAIAGDVPSLPTTYVVDALSGLAQGRRHAVIGPSQDGGYHLVGLRWDGAARWHPGWLRARRRRRLARRLERAFRGTTAGPDVCSETRARLSAAGWGIRILDAWGDIDTVADLDRLRVTLEGTDASAPATAAWLAAHGELVATRLPAIAR